MAEFVQQSLEEMTSELQQLQRVELFSPQEVKSILKKRTTFEYKIQKQQKNKADFLGYIQYEVGVLSLLKIRREKIGYTHKKHEIDYAIAQRINKLYRILEHRFASDTKIWTSHIAFLKEQGWRSAVSKIYRRMLQEHQNNIGMWIAAAKFEMEDVGNAETARTVMLEAIRFHPKSERLFREYFRLELMFVDQLKKRSQVLGIAEEDLNDLPDETRDAVLDGKIAMAVYRKAVAEIGEAGFVGSLLAVACDFEFTAQIQWDIVESLKEDFAAEEIAYDTRARYELVQRGRSLNKSVEQCCEVYESGLERLPTKKMYSLYLDTLLEIPSLCSKAFVQSMLAAKLLRVLKEGSKEDLIEEKYYRYWLALESEKRNSIVEAALIHYPASLLFIREYLTTQFESSTSDFKQLKEWFFRHAQGIEDEGDEVLKLWEFTFMNLSNRDYEFGTRFIEEAIEKFPKLSGSLKVFHLERIFVVKGLDAARKFYVTQKYVPPFRLSFHAKMLELETDSKPVDKSKIREVFEAMTDQFGSDNTSVWVDFLRFEENNGEAVRCNQIRQRANRSLKDGLKEAFRMEVDSA